MSGTLGGVLGGLLGGGLGHALGGPLGGSLGGTLGGAAAAAWVGSQDDCDPDVPELDGMGTGRGSPPTNQMHPRGRNCHFFGDPQDPLNECGGDCPPRRM